MDKSALTAIFADGEERTPGGLIVPRRRSKVTATLHSPSGREVARAHNTVTADGIAHAYARIFGTGPAFAGSDVRAQTGGGTELAALDAGFPQAFAAVGGVGNEGGTVRWQTAEFMSASAYDLGSLQLTDGTDVLFSSETWSGNPNLTALNIVSRYYLVWSLDVRIPIGSAFDPSHVGDPDDPDETGYLEFGPSGLLLAQIWAGLANSFSTDTLKVWLYAPDYGSGLPPGPIDGDPQDREPPDSALNPENFVVTEKVTPDGIAVGTDEVVVTWTVPEIDERSYEHEGSTITFGGDGSLWDTRVAVLVAPGVAVPTQNNTVGAAIAYTDGGVRQNGAGTVGELPGATFTLDLIDR